MDVRQHRVLQLANPVFLTYPHLRKLMSAVLVAAMAYLRFHQLVARHLIHMPGAMHKILQLPPGSVLELIQ